MNSQNTNIIYLYQLHMAWVANWQYSWRPECQYGDTRQTALWSTSHGTNHSEDSQWRAVYLYVCMHVCMYVCMYELSANELTCLQCVYYRYIRVGRFAVCVLAVRRCLVLGPAWRNKAIKMSVYSSYAINITRSFTSFSYKRVLDVLRDSVLLHCIV